MTAIPAHTSAITTPWSVRNELKGFPPKAVQAGRVGAADGGQHPVREAPHRSGTRGGPAFRVGLLTRPAPGRRTALLPRDPEPAAGLRGPAALGLLRFLGRRGAALPRPAGVGELQLGQGVADPWAV